jgi:hypothetical protein
MNVYMCVSACVIASVMMHPNDARVRLQLNYFFFVALNGV